MAKRYLLIAASALALTACSSEEVIDDVAASRNQIRFENVVNKPSRAVKDLDMNSLLQFNVFGFYTMPEDETHAHEVFNNVAVKKKTVQYGVMMTSSYAIGYQMQHTIFMHTVAEVLTLNKKVLGHSK